MPLTRDQAATLATLANQLRPTWSEAGVMAALKKLAHDPRAHAAIAHAVIRAAMDTHALTPAVIPTDGSHWRHDPNTEPPAPRLTPEHECNLHPGKWASNCPSCHADRHAGDTPATYNPADPHGAIARNAAREARAAAHRAHLEWLAANPDHDKPVTVTRDNPVNTPETGPTP